MAIEKIEIKDILIEDSRFSLRDVLFRSEDHLYNDSFDKLGILNPVIVWSDGENFHVVDGEKRIQYAKQNGMATIHAVTLSEDTPVTDIITLILCDKREDIESSIMNRVQFICRAISLNVPEEWVVGTLCVTLGLKSIPDILQRCERINAMPKELRAFCHEKRFSLKQLINLSSYPDDLLSLLVEWNMLLHLTASTMDEIASNLRIWLRSKNKSVDDLMNDAEIREILGSSMDPRDKTGSLRQLFRIRQFPVLSEVNLRIEKSVSDLKLPKEISIKWDRTLENKNAALSINISNPQKWQRLLEALGSKELKDALKDILDEL